MRACSTAARNRVRIPTARGSERERKGESGQRGLATPSLSLSPIHPRRPGRDARVRDVYRISRRGRRRSGEFVGYGSENGRKCGIRSAILKNSAPLKIPSPLAPPPVGPPRGRERAAERFASPYASPEQCFNSAVVNCLDRLRGAPRCGLMEGTLEEPAIKDTSRNSPDKHPKGKHSSPLSPHGLRPLGRETQDTF